MTFSVLDIVHTNCGMFFHDWLWVIIFLAQLPVEYFKREGEREREREKKYKYDFSCYELVEQILASFFELNKDNAVLGFSTCVCIQCSVARKSLCREACGLVFLRIVCGLHFENFLSYSF